MKKFLLCTLCASIFAASALLGACDLFDKSDTGNDPDNGKEDETQEAVTDMTYADAIQSPALPAVDETGYTVYYFDGTGGNDANDGLSQTTAKKSLSAMGEVVNGVTQPTKILLKAGTTFTGSVQFRNYSATKAKPLVIDRYGSESDYPLINGNTANPAVSVIGENVHIRHLEIKNPNGKQGIYVRPAHTGASYNVVIEGCSIHEVKWSWNASWGSVEDYFADPQAALTNEQARSVCSDGDFAYATAGIYLHGYDDTNDTYRDARWYEDCWITNNTIREIGRCGITVESRWVGGNGVNWDEKNHFVDLDHGWYPMKNVVVSGNKLSYIGGDGIVTLGVQDTYIEHNQLLYSAILGRGNVAMAGIWPVNARRVYMQFNEAAFTKRYEGCGDGQGFDIDIGCSDVIFQYNYSHDNDGGGLLMCNRSESYGFWADEDGSQSGFGPRRGNWNNVRVRNNVFANNGFNGSPAFFHVDGSCNNILCENNTVILPYGTQNQRVILATDYNGSGVYENCVLRNNLFYAEEDRGQTVSLQAGQPAVCFENNLFYRFGDAFFEEGCGATKENSIRNIDPYMEGVPSELNGFDVLQALKPYNPEVFKKGMQLSEWCNKDILGATPTTHYIGAFCR